MPVVRIFALLGTIMLKTLNDRAFERGNGSAQSSSSLLTTFPIGCGITSIFIRLSVTCICRAALLARMRWRTDPSSLRLARPDHGKLPAPKVRVHVTRQADDLSEPDLRTAHRTAVPVQQSPGAGSNDSRQLGHKRA
jgi:hypothetical protein